MKATVAREDFHLGRVEKNESKRDALEVRGRARGQPRGGKQETAASALARRAAKVMEQGLRRRVLVR